MHCACGKPLCAKCTSTILCSSEWDAFHCPYCTRIPDPMRCQCEDGSPKRLKLSPLSPASARSPTPDGTNLYSEACCLLFCGCISPRCASIPSQTTSRIRESQESGSCAKEGRSHGKPKDAGKPDRSSASPIIDTANGSARLICHQMNDARQAFLELRQQSSFSTQDTGNTDAPPASDFPSTMV